MKSRKSSQKSTWPGLPDLLKLRNKGWTAVLLTALALLGGYLKQQDKPEHRPRTTSRTKAPRTTGAVNQVVGVHDGDTITVSTGPGPQLKVRLYGIDAPELNQAYGNAAKEALSGLVSGRTVNLEIRNTDLYGRTVATVIVDGMDVNAAMVRSGFAWHYKAYSNDAGLAVAEQEARSDHRGLWAGRAPVPPWEFRKGKS